MIMPLTLLVTCFRACSIGPFTQKGRPFCFTLGLWVLPKTWHRLLACAHVHTYASLHHLNAGFAGKDEGFVRHQRRMHFDDAPQPGKGEKFGDRQIVVALQKRKPVAFVLHAIPARGSQTTHFPVSPGRRLGESTRVPVARRRDDGDSFVPRALP